MKDRCLVALCALPCAILILAPAPVRAAGQPEKAAKAWTAPRTPWGDPDLQGTYTNKDENATPMERPAGFEGRSIENISENELAALVRERQKQHDQRAPTLGGAETGAGPPHWFESFAAANSRPWLVVDPNDGKIPAVTPEAQKLRAAQAANPGRDYNGPANTYTDFGLYERCITLGIPGSMTPMIYGNAYEIVQAPGYVAIRYEMVHETRVIPLDRPEHVGQSIRPYMGDARGHWEGDSLVVETTNFKTGQRGSSEKLRLVERFTRSGPNKVNWEVTFDDPATWTRPWTFAMPLKQDPEHQVFEYACHEGNQGLANILSASRAEEAERDR